LCFLNATQRTEGTDFSDALFSLVRNGAHRFDAAPFLPRISMLTLFSRHRLSRRWCGRFSAAAGLIILLTSNSLHAERAFEAWVHRFDPNANATQAGTAIAFDANGNACVTGYTFNADAEAFYTAKYDGLTGRAIWEKTFDSGNGSDVPHAIVVDSVGNVIVTGSSAAVGGGLDYYTIKYDGTNGNVIWQRRYDGPNNGLDEAIAVGVDSADNVIVAGRSTQANDDIYLIRYAAATGLQTGQFRFTGPLTRPDYPADMAVDAAGNPVVVGVTTNANGDADIYVAKINLTTETAIWTRTINSAANLDDEGKGVAIDNAGNVIVTGIVSNNDNTHGFLTRKYSATGVFAWDQTFVSPVADFHGPVDVGVDSAGNAFVTGTSTLDNFKVTFYTAKYAAANGTILWETRSSLPPGATDPFQNDVAAALAVDGSGNVVVTGLSQNANVDDDYYTVKYAGSDGHILWQDHRNGDNESGQDRPAAVAIDNGGNVAVTGISKKAEGPFFQMLTVKYGRFLAAERDEVPGGGVPNSGVPEGSTFAALFPPAVADNGAVTARVTIADGKKRLSAIFLEGGTSGASLPAVQDAEAPGVADAKFKSFLEPVIAPNGRVAFIATLRGVKGSEAAGVWTTLFTGTLQLALQKGNQVPGLPQGTKLSSVFSISARNAQLIALLKVSGKEGGVTRSNSTVLLGLTAGGGTSLLRTGDSLTVGGDESEIRSINVLTPAKISPGQGRYQGDGNVVARLTLADKRTVLVSVSTAGVITPLLFTGQSSSITNGAVWRTFGLPALGTAGANFAALGALEPGEGDVSKGDDAALVFSNTGANFTSFAREGATAPGTGGAVYSAFFDPLVNAAGEVAFVATLKGDGVKGTNRAGLWWGVPGGIQKVARLGDSAPGPDGEESDAEFNAILSTALPSGTGAGPLFLAKVSGKGVNKKNNIGLWGVDSSGLLRQILRTGSTIGAQTIARLTLLQPVRGALGARRSYNATGGIAVLIAFTDKSEAILQLSVP
jgi:hypothetical protein